MNIDTCNAYLSSLTFPIDVGQNPPSGITWYDHSSIPELHGLVQAVTGINQGLIAYTMNATMDSVVNKQYYLRYEYGRVRDACAGPDGSLYFIAYDRSSPRIMRVRNALNTGISGASSFELAVYPNPCTDRVRFTTALPAVTTSAILRNMQGEIVLRQKVEVNAGLLDVGMLPAGVYYLQVGNSVPKMLLKL
ncbi:MAG: T9SS type A sorting domain-containing protein [Bacteroidota bacterium]